MPDTPPTLTVRLIADISTMDAAHWDRCAGNDNPFLTHAFLSALEESGSVGGRTGWVPRHVVVQDETGQPLALAPCYVKMHSYGEYVFDHGWADAYQRAGGQYYPKLQVAVPFTPVPGPRLLVRSGLDAGTLLQARHALLQGLEAARAHLGASSIHITFTTAEEYQIGLQAGWLGRLGHQYHWFNQGYAKFDDFLATLSSRKRKAVRKERREVTESGLEIITLTGADIPPDAWQAFYQFYRGTSDRKWGSPYLTLRFFELLGQKLGSNVVLIMAREHGQWVAGALNLRGHDALYGRNWGCAEHVKFLHFEACYYRAIDYAITHNLSRVEAGAQGEHKIQRGYLPVPTYSLHQIADPALHRAVADYLDRERPAVQAEIDALIAEYSPYKKAGDVG